MSKTMMWIIGVAILILIIFLIWRAFQKPVQPPEGLTPPGSMSTPALEMVMLKMEGAIVPDQVFRI